jgi:hypothetical protein
MYIRFVCATGHPHADAELGIYRAGDLISFEDRPEALIQSYIHALEACADLPVPPCLRERPTTESRRGLSWLRHERQEWVERFRALARVMTEMGVPIGEIATRRPGRIIYSDRNQVVAIPDRRVHRAFRVRPVC